jgi:spore coat-associated protein N
MASQSDSQTPAPPVATGPEEEGPSRFDVMLRNRRRLLIGLGLILLAAAVAVGSTAVFTSSSANPGNTVTAGTLEASNDKEGAAILTANRMVPGESKNGTVTISNTGDVSGTFSLSSSNLSNAPGPNGGRISDVLQLRIAEGANAPFYNGPYNAMPKQDLGSWPAGEEHTYEFTVTFPQGGQPGSDTTGDNAYEGSSTSIDFTWDAVSS